MANQLQREPTEADAHAVATMLAMRLSINTIIGRTGLSKYGIAKVQRRADWQDMLKRKQEVIAGLLAGGL